MTCITEPVRGRHTPHQGLMTCTAPSCHNCSSCVFIPAIKEQAYHQWQHMHKRVPLEDLEWAGIAGLLKAMPHLHTARRPVAIVCHWAKLAMVDHVRSWQHYRKCNKHRTKMLPILEHGLYSDKGREQRRIEARLDLEWLKRNGGNQVKPFKATGLEAVVQ